jgi:hypothetical protein
MESEEFIGYLQKLIDNDLSDAIVYDLLCFHH